MKALRAAVLLLPLAGSPALAQTSGPGEAAKGAEGTTTDGKPAPDGRQGEGKQSATQGSKMTRPGAPVPPPPSRSEAPKAP